MASYTDTVPKFNPYYQQLPVEEMVDVGMYKQKLHDEGVQKIQTQIDNIAGLDIGRDVDKAYLQSKINQLGNNLRSVASGDFSNYQLVSSTGGMIKQIEKDPYITSAVYSTANDRKQASMMEEDRKKGTLTPQAEYYYGLKRNKYYSNSSLKDQEGNPISFSGKYVQSWDLDKNILEAVKAVGDSKWTVDKIFKMNPNTNEPMKDKNGIPIISDYARREIRQGKFNENILAAIDSVLIKPEARQELNMRGVYNYRGQDKIEDFIKGYEKEKESGLQLLESRRIDVMSKAANEKDPARKEALLSLVNKIEGEMTTLEQREDVQIADAKQFNSVEAYKGALQTRQTRNSYLKAYVTETVSDEVIRNIPYDVAQEKIAKDRDWWAKQQTVAQGWQTKDLEERKFGFEQKKWSENKDNIKNIPTMPLGGDLTTKPVSEVDIVTDFMNKGEELSSSFTTGKRDFVIDYLVTLNAYNKKDMTKEQIARDVDNWSSKDPKWIDKFYEKSKNDVNSAKGSMYSNMKTRLPVMQDLENQLITHGNRTEDINKHPAVIAAGGKELDIATVGKGFKPFTIDYEGYDPGLLFGGNRGLFQAQPKYSKTVTSADAVNAGLVHSYSVVSHTATEKALYEKAKAALEAKFEVPLRDIMANFGLASTGANAVQRVNPALKSVVDKVGSHKFANVLQAKAAVLKEKSLGNQPLSLAVYPSNIKGPERSSVDDRLKNVLSTFQSGGIDVSDFNSVYVGSEKAGYTSVIGIERGTPNNPSDTFSLELYNGTTKVKSVPLTKGQVDYIRGEQVKLPNRVSDVQERLQWSGEKGTTNSITGNLDSPDAPRGAYYTQSFFRKNFNRKDIKGADVKINGMGEHNLYLYLEDKQGNVDAIPVKNRAGDEYPASFTSGDAADMFLRQTLSTSGEIDNIINNSK